MIVLLWLKGIVASRLGRMGLTAAGIALGTSLLALVGLYAADSARTMTQRAVSALPVDWQVALASGIDGSGALKLIRDAGASRAALPVGFADVASMHAVTGGTVQTTGSGVVVGLPAGYSTTFPGQLRLLTGSLLGPLLGQQTAANLHAGVGDVVTVSAAGGIEKSFTIAGIVDLPNADSLFQIVGAAKATAPTAPPDNVLLLPMTMWNDAANAFGNGSSARLQVHVGLIRADLPGDPAAAFAQVAGRVRNLEARSAGLLAVGDNLGRRLDAVRQDALFARVLLLALGLPGLALGTFLSVAVTSASADGRAREQDLLRARGAAPGLVLGLMLVEGLVVAVIGAAVSAGIVIGVARFLPSQPSSPELTFWSIAGATFAAVLALVAVGGTVLVDVRSRSNRQRDLLRRSSPLWQRYGADFALLILAGLDFWRSANSGYQVVLVPEGVPAASVDFMAFLAPALFWSGSCLLVIRLTRLALRSDKVRLSRLLLQPMGRIAPWIASWLAFEHARISRSTALTAMAIAFATSTSVFNATYDAQARVDASLTNGADVSVVGTSSATAEASFDTIVRSSGVAAAEPMIHRFAYVGNDLQDIYGVDASRIERATDIADAYFANGDAKTTMARLAAKPDAILVSQETVDDYQLTIGDRVNVRLQDARDHQYRVVPFQLAGIVREFPTAPRDSFLVANRDYLASQTGGPLAETVLVRAKGDPSAVAQTIRTGLGPSSALRVTEVGESARIIGSSLTSVDLHRLTTIELVYAVLFGMGATGLVLGLGFVERLRSYAILVALGARRSDVARVLWGEAAVVLVGGSLAGITVGTVVALMLVKLLSGVFDPPPEALTVPWSFLGIVIVTVIVASSAAVALTSHFASERVSEKLRSVV